jgi:hypothetical protein
MRSSVIANSTPMRSNTMRSQGVALDGAKLTPGAGSSLACDRL